MAKLTKQNIVLDQNDMIKLFGNYNSRGRNLVRGVVGVVTDEMFDVTTGMVAIDKVAVKVVNVGGHWVPAHNQH